MPPPLQRSACDRCHAQKLRCTRPAGLPVGSSSDHNGKGGGGSIASCARCVKSRSDCTWSPSLRRPKRNIKTGDGDAETVGRPGGRHPFTPQSEPATAAGVAAARPSEPEFVNGVTPADDAAHASAIDVNSSLLLTASPSQLAQPYSLDTGLTGILQPDQLVPAWATAHTDNVAAATGAPATTSDGPRPSGFAGCGGRSPLFVAQLGSQEALDTWQLRFNREWALLSTANETTTAPDADPPQQLSHEPTTAAPDDDGPCQEQRQLDALSSIRSLSDLNVELFALVAAIPQPPVCKTAPLTWKNKDVAIDKTFQLSHRLIEVLNKLSPRYLEAAIHEAAIHESDAGEIQRRGVDMDQASLLLVLSCYQRLVDAYRTIFGNMQACLDRSFVTAREDYVRMPEVRVGSFTLPDSSALQITLILQLARHLLQRVGAIIKCIEEKSGAMRHGEDGLLALTFKVVATKEDELVGTIAAVRQTLVSLDIL
ncbi:hypothetical protein ColTof4_05245 [Colletotrichum tofieldiae]|nr:hypothetical protein ColTof3_10504 [Colletotrichum tofieldiae]GKT72822.1 hypothetical protein ColTof4_05245 [Colletotrichum tofieldiae]